jgi:hypothetical protein
MTLPPFRRPLLKNGGVKQHFAEFLGPFRAAVFTEIDGLSAKSSSSPSASVIQVSIQANCFEGLTGTSKGGNKLNGSRKLAVQHQDVHGEV